MRFKLFSIEKQDCLRADANPVFVASVVKISLSSGAGK